MILTKQKIDNGTLTDPINIGHNVFSMDITKGENFWIDWAVSFQEMCKSKLGLEIERGPGTSVGIIQTSIGPTRYQYDCDWNKKDGRLDLFPLQERGFTFWEGIPTWDTMTNETGIDYLNKRFDFILWFTAPSTDTRDEREGSRLGLRFRYPLTHEMGYYVAARVSKVPVIMPWASYDSNKNSYYESQLSNYGTSRTGTIDIIPDNFFRIRTFNNYGPTRSTTSSGAYTNKISITTTGTFDFTSLRYNWKKYADEAIEIGDEEKDRVSYSTLGGDYNSFTTKGAFGNFKTLEVLTSKNFDTIDFRVKKDNNEILFDILFGNLLTEQYKDGEVLKETTPSFISIVTNTGLDYTNNFSDFVMTDFGVVGNPSKQVVRPTALDTTNQRSYWGISRLLLDGTSLHCRDLYQVFSFSDLLANTNSIYSEKVFIDKNNEEHRFLLFNHGYIHTDDLVKKAIALAIPID